MSRVKRNDSISPDGQTVVFDPPITVHNGESVSYRVAYRVTPDGDVIAERVHHVRIYKRKEVANGQG